jgi:hypothetical protein
MIIWSVAYQTTHMGIFEWIGYGNFTAHKHAIQAASEIIMMSDSEEIINVRVRREVR